MTFSSNQALLYTVQLEETEDLAKVDCVYGEMTSHKQEIRGVVMSSTDRLFATNSFDSVKIWQVDLAPQNHTGYQIECKSSLDEMNVMTMAMLPGDKYLVLGTREGILSLYELGSNSII